MIAEVELFIVVRNDAILLPSSSTSLIKGHVRIADKFNTSDFLLFAINSTLTDNGAWWTIPVSNEAQGGNAFTNLEDVIVSFVVTGDS
mgnify:CR=1 FL=1